MKYSSNGISSTQKNSVKGVIVGSIPTGCFYNIALEGGGKVINKMIVGSWQKHYILILTFFNAFMLGFPTAISSESSDWSFIYLLQEQNPIYLNLQLSHRSTICPTICLPHNLINLSDKWPTKSRNSAKSLLKASFSFWKLYLKASFITKHFNFFFSLIFKEPNRV